MEPPSPVDAAADEPPAALLPAAAELLEPEELREQLGVLSQTLADRYRRD